MQWIASIAQVANPHRAMKELLLGCVTQQEGLVTMNLHAMYRFISCKRYTLYKRVSTMQLHFVPRARQTSKVWM
jgi:hypothetical protein